ncbi:hypothetical protein LTS17_005606 [Exophiala oligosperma]
MTFPTDLVPVSWTTGLVAIVLALILRALHLTVQRCFFHPLAKIPGPRLAAISYLYEFYYDAWLGGKYCFHIEDLHEKYGRVVWHFWVRVSDLGVGPVVRINPNEIHIKDSEYYDKFYNISSKLNKDPFYYGFLDGPDAAFATDSFLGHRQRRKAFNKFFSPAALNALEIQVQKNITQLVHRMEEFKASGRPLRLGNAFRSLARDVISQYALPDGFHLLESPDLGEDLSSVNQMLSHVAIWNRHFRFIFPVLMATPSWLMHRIASPGMIQLMKFQMYNYEQSRRIVVGSDKGDDRETVLHGIHNSDLPESDKTPARLFSEATTIVGAGSETTGATLETLFYFILTKPDIRSKLVAELESAKQNGADISSKATLLGLPYLGACMKECLRYGNEVSGRLPRYDPNNVIVWRDHSFPPGTIISMNIADMHMDPNCHPRPHEFDPERWLDPSTAATAERFYAPFGKGSRACIGRDLAQLEVLITTATLLDKFDLRIFETEYDDVKPYHDFFSPFQKEGSKGLQVIVQ